jgi:hypothetical protein
MSTSTNLFTRTPSLLAKSSGTKAPSVGWFSSANNFISLNGGKDGTMLNTSNYKHQPHVAGQLTLHFSISPLSAHGIDAIGELEYTTNGGGAWTAFTGANIKTGGPPFVAGQRYEISIPTPATTASTFDYNVRHTAAGENVTLQFAEIYLE